MMRNQSLTGTLLLVGAAVAWGGAFPAGKIALGALDAFYLTAIRYGIAAAVFVGILAWAEGARGLRLEGKAMKAWGLGTIGFAGGVLLMFEGLARTRPEHGAVVVATQPLIAALLNWVLRGERPAGATLAAIGVAFGGVTLVITRGHPGTLFSGDAGLGDLLILIAAIAWVTYTLGAAAFPGWSALRYTAHTTLFGAASVAGITAAAGWAGYSHAPSLHAMESVGSELAYVTVAAAILGTLSWNSGIRMLGPVNGVQFVNFIPVTAIAVEIARGHRFEPVVLAGVAMVIAALVGNGIWSRRRAQANEPNGVEPLCPAGSGRAPCRTPR